MDIIIEVLKRVGRDVKHEIRETTYRGIVIALTAVLFVTLIVPTWVLAIAVLVGWGLIIKDNYDEFLEWATDAPEEEPTNDKEDVPPEDEKGVDSTEQK